MNTIGIKPNITHYYLAKLEKEGKLKAIITQNIDGLAMSYIYNADTLIVAGTSLTVEPASGLVKLFKGKNLVIINKTPTAYDNLATLVIHDSLKNIIGEISK